MLVVHPCAQIMYMWRVTAKGTLRPFLQVTGLVLIHSVIKRAAVFSRQEVHDYNRMQAMTTDVDQPPLIMLCIYKWSMVQWTELWYGTLQGLIPLFWDDQTHEPELRVYHPLQVFIIDWLLMIVNQTQVGATWGTFCCNGSHMVFIKGKLHSKPKMSMFCVLSQKFQHFFFFFFFCKMMYAS